MTDETGVTIMLEPIIITPQQATGEQLRRAIADARASATLCEQQSQMLHMWTRRADILQREFDSRGQGGYVTALDVQGLASLFAELYSLPPSSRKREYWRGRIDEYVAQNAVTDADVARAHAQGLQRQGDPYDEGFAS